MKLTITSDSSGHTATMGFGQTCQGSPLESLQYFVKELQAGRAEAEARPMDCGGMNLGDDFRPFLGKKLKRVSLGEYRAP